LPADLIAESDQFKGVDGTVFPDNWKSFLVFRDMLTQWRIGMNGITGMDYTALPAIPAIKRMTEEEYEDCFFCLQIMERAAIKHVRSK
jgi:hypothetical protein